MADFVTTVNTKEAVTAKTLGQPASLILTICGAYVRPLGSWIAVADLVTLMTQLGVDQQASRSAVSRLARRGLLDKETRGRTRGYRLTGQAEQILEKGDRRIFRDPQPARLEDGWVLVAFSIPEDERDRRHVLRSQLTRFGFGNLLNGLWFAPARSRDDLREIVTEFGFERYIHYFSPATYEGFEALEELVKSSWDLGELQRLYENFLQVARPLLANWRRRDATDHPLEAFVDYTYSLHHWRRFPYIDPGLPVSLLPRRWQGHKAAETFLALRELLSTAACEHVRSIVRRHHGVQRAADSTIYLSSD